MIMKKLLTVILALMILLAGTVLAETTQPAAELTYVEKVVYYGEGIFEIDFMRDVAWRTDYLMTLRDDEGTPLTLRILGGDASEAVVQAEGAIREDALYTFTLVSDHDVICAVGQSTKNFSYANYCEYCLEFGHDEKDCVSREAAGVYEVDRCDLCGELDHDDDSCPDRRTGIAYCDECGTYGHDDDDCIYDDDSGDCCDFCGQYGHSESKCINRAKSTPSPMVQSTPLPAVKSAAQTADQQIAASPTPLPKAGYCDECHEYGHDDDHCPNEKCDECGEYGHDDDHCPNEKCDECGEYGHDDDHCPNEKCDECGRYGHDDDDCPYDRDDD